ncbi:MAG: GDYXXLXY domain-containing protein [Verrucomicrobiota bacterium]
MKTRLLLVAGILGLQTAWILGTTFVQERELAQGPLILLETRPADPRDPLRRDYLTLNYKISDVPLTAFSPVRTNPVPPGATVYVALAPRGPFHEVVRASTEPLPPIGGQVVLKGRSRVWWNAASQQTVHVDYGLDYVRKGTGNPTGKLTVLVAVPASGRGRIKEVLVDGKPYAEAMQGVAK